MADDPEQGENDPLIKKSPVEQAKEELDRHATVRDDVGDIIKLGLPIFVAMLSWVGVSDPSVVLL